MAAQPPLVAAASLLARRRGSGRGLAPSRSGSRCRVGEGRAGGSVAVRGPRRRSCARELGAAASGARRSAERRSGCGSAGRAGARSRGAGARVSAVRARTSAQRVGGSEGRGRDPCPAAGTAAQGRPHTHASGPAPPSERLSCRAGFCLLNWMLPTLI